MCFVSPTVEHKIYTLICLVKMYSVFIFSACILNLIFTNVSNGSLIIQYFTVAVFCSKQCIFISNTATKEVPEDQEFSYYSAVLHQRMEGESPVTAAGSAW